MTSGITEKDCIFRGKLLITDWLSAFQIFVTKPKHLILQETKKLVYYWLSAVQTSGRMQRRNTEKSSWFKYFQVDPEFAHLPIQERWRLSKEKPQSPDQGARNTKVATA